MRARGMPAWMKLYAPPPDPPPVDHEINHAAEMLHAILVEDSFDALVSACADAGVREAVRALLVALAKARGAR